MKVRELLGNQLLLENITLSQVKSLRDLKDPKTGKYYTDEVNVKFTVNLNNGALGKLPVKFGSVGGSFYCTGSKLVSLEGAPHFVGISFDCDSNNLESLKGAPQKVNGAVHCYFNKLTSLEGAPQEIGNGFYCADNKITSLEGVHKIFKKVNGHFSIPRNPIKSGGIGLLLIEGIKQIIADSPAFSIINKYLGQGKKGLLLCQEELIEAGFEEYAKL